LIISHRLTKRVSWQKNKKSIPLREPRGSHEYEV